MHRETWGGKLEEAISTQNSPPSKQLAAHPYSKQQPQSPPPAKCLTPQLGSLTPQLGSLAPNLHTHFHSPAAKSSSACTSTPFPMPPSSTDLYLSSQSKPAALPFSATSTPPSPPTLPRRRQYTGSSVSTLHPNRA
ncbi:hypothetical protein EV1_023506 [Malus domestica]